MKSAFAALFCLGGFVIAGEEPTKFKVTTKKADDAVTVRVEKEGTVVSVRSPSGIGQAVVERKDEQWPETVVLRLHLKGLESFRISNGKATLDTAVSVQDGKPKMRSWKDGKEEMTLPKAFFEGNPQSITLNWIDFYRN